MTSLEQFRATVKRWERENRLTEAAHEREKQRQQPPQLADRIENARQALWPQDQALRERTEQVRIELYGKRKP